MRTASFVLLSCLALLAGACGGSSDSRQYQLQGQIISISPDRKDATVKHDEIKGFMSAMTMPYKGKDEKAYEGLTPGDTITATLVITSNDAFLQDVKKTGTAPLEAAPKEAASPSASSGFELLKLGEPVPDVQFIDQDGTHANLKSFRGHALVVTFIYTNCPMPAFCPLMDRNFAAMQTRLKANNNSLDVHLLSVSFDPVTDTPPVLKRHAQKLEADPTLWSFATGDRDEIDRWASRFGVSVSRALNDQRDITHNLRTAIIDRQGNLVQLYTGNEWTPDQALADVQVMVGID